MTQAPNQQDQKPGKPPLSSLLLEQTIYNLSQLRKTKLDLPQLALAGRSNVGKSSLLNALAQRKQLAKISSTPGKTRSINLFRVVPDQFLLTDLPGYGYAKRSKDERRQWGELIEYYLKNSSLLKAVVLLLDCRLPPQELDWQMANYCQILNIPLLPVLTKSDKASQKQRDENQNKWANILKGRKPLPVSSKTEQGLPELWRMMRRAVTVSEHYKAENDWLSHVGSIQAE